MGFLIPKRIIYFTLGNTKNFPLYLKTKLHCKNASCFCISQLNLMSQRVRVFSETPIMRLKRCCKQMDVKLIFHNNKEGSFN